MQRIMLPDEDAEIDPVPGAGGRRRGEPELDRLSTRTGRTPASSTVRPG